MDVGVHRVPAEQGVESIPCYSCGRTSNPWDRIAGKCYCHDCLEELAAGEADPVIERVQSIRCSICHHLGCLPYLTFPLHSQRPVEINLCSEHLRRLIGRCLGPTAFEMLRHQLSKIGLDVGSIFLLHEAFYDRYGRALMPVLPE